MLAGAIAVEVVFLVKYSHDEANDGEVINSDRLASISHQIRQNYKIKWCSPCPFAYLFHHCTPLTPLLPLPPQHCLHIFSITVPPRTPLLPRYPLAHFCHYGTLQMPLPQMYPSHTSVTTVLLCTPPLPLYPFAHFCHPCTPLHTSANTMPLYIHLSPQHSLHNAVTTVPLYTPLAPLNSLHTSAITFSPHQTPLHYYTFHTPLHPLAHF